MRNSKKLIAVIMTVALLASMMVPALAATNQSEADKLLAVGLLRGSGTGGLDLESDLTRAQGIILTVRAMGAEADALAMTSGAVALEMAKVNDASDIPYWAANYAAYAVKNNITNGTKVNADLTITFSPSNPLSGKQFIIMMLRSLGYTGVTLENCIEKALAANMLTATKVVAYAMEDQITRDDAAYIIYSTVNNGLVAIGGITPSAIRLVTQLVANNAISATAAAANFTFTAPTPVAAAPATVTGISASNLKEISITFSKNLDETTAQTAGNYVLSSGTLVTAVLTGNTVLLTLATNAAQQALVDVTISNVKDIDGLVIAEVTKSVKIFDSTIPTVTGIEVTGPMALTVTFSEPLTATNLAAFNNTANFSIDNNTYSISSVAGALGSTSLLVNLGSSLPAGAHTIKVNAAGMVAGNLQDYAGFFVVTADVAFTYVVDIAAPVASLDSAAQNTVTILFSKAIDAATKTNLSVYHTYNNNASFKSGVLVWAADNKSVTAPFASNYLPVGVATIYVNAGTSPNLVKDLWANALVDTVLTATVVADLVAPTVTSITVASSTSLEVTFSEAVIGATTVANYTLKDPAAAAVTISSAVLNAGTTATYTLTTAIMTGGTYTLAFANITDSSVSLNALVAVTKTIAVTDLVKPTVTATGVFSSDQKKIVISFSEIMTTTGVYSVLDESNYLVSYDTGATWTELKDITGATLSLNSGSMSVTITFATAQALLTVGDDITVARVADLAGNATAAFTSSVNLLADELVIGNIVLDSVKVLSNSKLSFQVNTPLSAINVGSFTLDGVAVASATYVNDATTATVTLSQTTSTFYSDGKVATLSGFAIAAGGITSSLGTANAAAVTVLNNGTDRGVFVDYASPVLLLTATNDFDADGHIDQIVITYDEPLYIPSVSETDYTVEGYVATAVSVTGAIATLTLTELTSFDTATLPNVTLVGAISDNSAQRNSLGAQAAVAATDGAKPVVVSATVVSGATAGFGNDVGDTLTLVFSEAVNTNFAVAAAPTLAELNAIFLGGVAGATAAPFGVAVSTFTATNLGTTAANTLVLTSGGAAITTPILATTHKIGTAATPTANDIEDVANLTIAGTQVVVTVQ